MDIKAAISAPCLLTAPDYSLPIPRAVAMGVFTDAIQPFSSEKKKQSTSNQHRHAVSESTFIEESKGHNEDHKAQKH